MDRYRTYLFIQDRKHRSVAMSRQTHRQVAMEVVGWVAAVATGLQSTHYRIRCQYSEQEAVGIVQ